MPPLVFPGCDGRRVLFNAPIPVDHYRIRLDLASGELTVDRVGDFLGVILARRRVDVVRSLQMHCPQPKVDGLRGLCVRDGAVTGVVGEPHEQVGIPPGADLLESTESSVARSRARKALIRDFGVVEYDLVETICW